MFAIHIAVLLVLPLTVSGSTTYPCDTYRRCSTGWACRLVLRSCSTPPCLPRARCVLELAPSGDCPDGEPLIYDIFSLVPCSACPYATTCANPNDVCCWKSSVIDACVLGTTTCPAGTTCNSVPVDPNCVGDNCEQRAECTQTVVDEDPCKNFQCGPGYRCEAVWPPCAPPPPSLPPPNCRPQPVCKAISKPGTCPTTAICGGLCQDDGNCLGSNKCCPSTCGGSVCISPAADPEPSTYPCDLVTCPTNTECRLKQPICEVGPCELETVCHPVQKCPLGVPLVSFGAELNCGRGGQQCPLGFRCNIHPADLWAVCCIDVPSSGLKQCPTGSSLPILDNNNKELVCGNRPNSVPCPFSAFCADEFGTCCFRDESLSFNPCLATTCLQGSVCEARSPAGCQRVPCNLESVCVPAGTVADPCESYHCPNDEVCRIERPVCVTTPCPPPGPVCRPRTKPGSCPVPQPGSTGPCYANCTIDADCSGEQKCCGNCPKICTEPIRDKSGLCPIQNPEAIGPCEVRCSSDSSCPGDQKCCGSCPRDCTPPEKPGFCRSSSPGLIGICIAECTFDSDCGGDQKCCGGCPRECVSPLSEKPGTCPQQTVVQGISCIVRCNSDRDCQGDFKCCGSCPKQCVAVPLPNQFVKPGFCPLSQVQQGSNCQEQCTNDFSCSRDSKCCSIGCSRICQQLLLNVPYASTDPCRGKICGSNEVCKLQDVICVQAPCYPIPICVTIGPGDYTSNCKSGYPVLGQNGYSLSCRSPRVCPSTTQCVNDDCCFNPDEVQKCRFGAPAVDANTRAELICQYSPTRQNCPAGYYCIDDVCCPDPRPKCSAGPPAVDPSTGFELFCGVGVNRQDCPSGYSCNVTNSLQWSVVCCPNPITGPCANIFCPDGFKCKPQTEQCSVPPCPERGVCVGTKKDGQCPRLPDVVCLAFDIQPNCADDADCNGTKKCCETSCGVDCTNPVATFVAADPCSAKACTTSRLCRLQNVCSFTGCTLSANCIDSSLPISKLCRSGYPLLDFTGRELDCSNCPQNTVCFEGVCCWDPEPPKPKCSVGTPAVDPRTGVDVFCGTGPTSQVCPFGYSCIFDPNNRFAFCCPNSREPVTTLPVTTTPAGPPACSDPGVVLLVFCVFYPQCDITPCNPGFQCCRVPGYCGLRCVPTQSNK